MTITQLLILVLSALLVLFFLFAGTFFLLFLERLVRSRTQHREGPGRHGNLDVFQVWKDYLKTRVKQQRTIPTPWRFRLAMAVWRALPAIFLLLLLGGLMPTPLEDAELPALLLLPLLAVSLEAFFLHATTDSRERIEWRKHLVLKVMGASVLVASFLAITLKVGLPSLSAISEAQRSFPYHSLFASPGLFLCAIAAMGAIFLFSSENPMENKEELSLSRSGHYLIFFVRKMWIFCLLSFWVFVFFGGDSGLVAKALFPVKVAAAIFFFIMLQGSFPRVRSADAGELAARWLFRLCLAGIIVEAVWVGVNL